MSMSLKSQPIPVELMAGNNYATVIATFGRNFTKDSRFGFFHMNTIQSGYRNKDINSIIVEDLFYYEPLKNFRLACGAAYSIDGFNTTAGIQYLFIREKFFLLFAPRVNIVSDPSYDVITILQYKPVIRANTKLYTRFQMLNLFVSEGNLQSYQWFRLGIEVRDNQFGLAFNLDEYGFHPKVETNYGVFFRREIF